MKNEETILNLNEERKGQKGQFILEYILIGVFVISVYTLIRGRLGDQNLISRVFTGPWSSVAKMMEDGTWNTSLSEDQVHPLSTNISRIGDTN